MRTEGGGNKEWLIMISGFKIYGKSSKTENPQNKSFIHQYKTCILKSHLCIYLSDSGFVIIFTLEMIPHLCMDKYRHLNIKLSYSTGLIVCTWHRACHKILEIV